VSAPKYTPSAAREGRDSREGVAAAIAVASNPIGPSCRGTSERGYLLIITALERPKPQYWRAIARSDSRG
jgi:hypothetical protein